MLMNNEAWDNKKEIWKDFEKKIKRNNWGNSEKDGRGENPWSSLDKRERKHFTQLYSLIKNES